MRSIIIGDIHGCDRELCALLEKAQPGKEDRIILLGDLFARTVISPVILPIGAITSFLGGPLFLYLLFKGGKKQ